MTPPICIRTQMLQRAARLVSGTHSEEAWYLIGLFQQSQPTAFLHICHRILASFLELTHDHFDNGWPIKSRLHTRAVSGTPSNTQERRRIGREKLAQVDSVFDCDSCNCMNYEMNPAFDKLLSYPHTTLPTCPGYCNPDLTLAWPPTQCSPALLDPRTTTAKPQSGLGKLKTMAARRLFKQLLPSKPHAPTCFANNSHTEVGGKSHVKGTRMELTPADVFETTSTMTPQSLESPAAGPTPLSSNTWNRSTVASCRPVVRTIVSLMGPDNLDSIICRCLIEYMLENPSICSTEGLFRIPGNSQRIRDLWFQLQNHLQAPYIRMPQPDPDSSVCEQTDCWDVCSILDAYSPHDVTSLLLRCLTSCSQSLDTSKQYPFHPISEETSSSGCTSGGAVGSNCHPGGLIPTQTSELCFLATRLQYALDRRGQSVTADSSEDWMHILCRSRQLLTYRIVLQFLLPIPERSILMGLLQVFRQVTSASATSLMSAECLARCTAVAVFGSPTMYNTAEQLSNSDPDGNPLRWRIDTLTNLIQMFDQLDELPAVVYLAVRNRLRSHFGHSPIQKLPHTPICSQWSVGIMRDTKRRCYQSTYGIQTAAASLSDLDSPKTPSYGNAVKLSGPSVLLRTNASRISLHRAQSSLETHVSHVSRSSQPQTAEPFKFWRRQKVSTNLQSQRLGFSNRLTKVRSASVLKHSSLVTSTGKEPKR
ncbi:RhoGAP domain protein [Paragonimus skrjabini miyazakii]|uniref:RhoGAP domain protein n=1 Tax=Paragonimus skrjabini miyazakii TaxID=59628 RepID=A0A8S9YBU1_9TREM|nr:RhoGAP domain protein [Paragonimus skrjabini miyazakii]